jgi:hypothetical protein
MFAGTSKKKYPIKNNPAPIPYTVSLIPKSLCIWSLANPTLTRSM